MPRAAAIGQVGKQLIWWMGNPIRMIKDRLGAILRSEGAMIILLALLGALQVGILLNSYVIPWGKSIYQVREAPAWQRSGLLTPWIGPDAVYYFDFLRQQTPPDATVVFAQDDFLYGSRPMLQYFLFPRHVVVCSPDRVSVCFDGLSRGSAYLAVIEGHPDSADIPYAVVFHAFGGRADTGVFAPARCPVNAGWCVR